MAGIQYLDALFAAIRDAGQQLEEAKGWMARAEKAHGSTWQMHFLQEADAAHVAARSHLDEAFQRLAELGPANRLPSLLAHLPQRLVELQLRLDVSEAMLSIATDACADKPLGSA